MKRTKSGTTHDPVYCGTCSHCVTVPTSQLPEEAIEVSKQESSQRDEPPKYTSDVPVDH